MKAGEKLTNCKGSYLQKYLNGKMVKSVGLAYAGGAVGKLSGAAGYCVVSLAGAATLAWSPVAATGVWLIATAATALGVIGSCTNL